MKSAWLINFKNGNKVILTEETYKKYDKETSKEEVDTEEHWFSMEKCIKVNPNVDLVE
jgi:tRNA A58 N-methylase Trm61